MNELDILAMDVGGQTVKAMSNFSFLQWVALKLNNVESYSTEVVELTAMVRNPTMSRTMPDDKKLEIIRKLQKANISLT